MRPVFFSDLDDTVFQTARKMDAPPPPERLAAEALNGSHSYMTAGQDMMIKWLLASTRFIPVTARSSEALARCKLPFADYQICTNGGVILTPEGMPDADWHARMKHEADAVASGLENLMSFMARQTPAGRFRYWIVEDFGVGFYFCVKSNEDARRLDDIDAELCEVARAALVRHRNDNNLSFTPAGISKRGAVQYLAEKLGLDGSSVPVFGMGDSLTDLPFMAACDMLVIPKKSQIAQTKLYPEDG
ncbi:hypothetical protein TH25_10355 [Thalassospira profundimaris]|uniref:Sucrose phosphatase-like domain-containing protein n=1 Tax=Thalassospira profundimaris TaxID=502049 RepID=A0A367XB49_9PROT|nr:HAD family hydrolase [Thalassospira profundimaris]RCK50679.1 hypothetical protein TH25_10355 [Thalassospira profundimaris]